MLLAEGANAKVQILDLIDKLRAVMHAVVFAGGLLDAKNLHGAQAAGSFLIGPWEKKRTERT